MSGEPGTRLAVLQNRDFTFFLAARFLATLAVQMQTVAVGWQVYSVTRDPLDLGLVGLSQFLPFVLLTLPAGHVADNHDRRRILAACFALEALCALLLLAFAARGLDSARPVFAVMVLFGVARAFAMPTLGAPVVYASVAALLVVAVGLLLVLRRGGGRAQSTEPPGWYTLLSGLRFVRSNRPVLGAISLDLFAVLFGGATALLPVFAADVLHVGPSGLGLLRTAPGIGAALCGVVLGLAPLTRQVGRVATLVFGLSTSFWLSLAALAVMGAGDMVSVYIRHLLVQLETPDEIRGRVSAVNAVFIGASNELGEFESGLTAAWFGTVPAVIVGGCATLLVAGTWTRLFPEIWRMDRFPGGAS